MFYKQALRLYPVLPNSYKFVCCASNNPFGVIQSGISSFSCLPTNATVKLSFRGNKINSWMSCLHYQSMQKFSVSRQHSFNDCYKGI